MKQLFPCSFSFNDLQNERSSLLKRAYSRKESRTCDKFYVLSKFSYKFQKNVYEGFSLLLRKLTKGRKVYLKDLIEFRWHGRGGQGSWTASEVLARTAIYEGKYIQSFPEFGPERMGAPVTAFTRISTRPIRIHCAVYEPDVVVVLDPTLLRTVPVTSGVNKDGIIIINSAEDPAKVRETLKTDNGKLWTIPATHIALKILGMPITNTAMLGTVARATNIVSLDSVKLTLKERFRPDLAEKNFAVVKEAYEEAKQE
jgi:2-oxoacid:acceptor oxidoreductase gamma subunit (pyruvate/2-ketoisovalerate family)